MSPINLHVAFAQLSSHACSSLLVVVEGMEGFRLAVDCELAEGCAVFYWSASTKSMIETFVEPAVGGVADTLYIRLASKHHALKKNVYVRADVVVTTTENGQADDVEPDDEIFVQRFLKWLTHYKN